MKPFVKFVVIGLLVVSCFTVVPLITRALTVYATEETKSAFLKDYSPSQVEDCFNLPYSSQEFRSAGSAAGCRFATHQTEITKILAIRTEDVAALTTAMRKDISLSLRARGLFVQEEGSSAEAYTFRCEREDYRYRVT